MLNHNEMIDLQAEEHWLVNPDTFLSKQDYVLHLIGKSAYFQATNLAQDKTALDLGCNTGFGTDMISKNAKFVIGVDVSEKAINVAKGRYLQNNIEFRNVNGINLPFENNKFDLITSFQVIEHIVEYDTYINEIKRVLKSDGIVLFTTPNSKLRLDDGMKPWNKFHVREFNKNDLHELLFGFFNNVKVMGLFAEEPLYSIELNRLNRARNLAKKKDRPLRDYVKRFFTAEQIYNIKKTIKELKREYEKKEEIAFFMTKYCLNSIFYKADDLDNSLDFLAICTDNLSELNQAWESLPKSINNK